VKERKPLPKKQEKKEPVKKEQPVVKQKEPEPPSTPKATIVSNQIQNSTPKPSEASTKKQ